jgi:hypothetical protein
MDTVRKNSLALEAAGGGKEAIWDEAGGALLKALLKSAKPPPPLGGAESKHEMQKRMNAFQKHRTRCLLCKRIATEVAKKIETT